VRRRLEDAVTAELRPPVAPDRPRPTWPPPSTSTSSQALAGVVVAERELGRRPVGGPARPARPRPVGRHRHGRVRTAGQRAAPRARLTGGPACGGVGGRDARVRRGPGSRRAARAPRGRLRAGASARPPPRPGPASASTRLTGWSARWAAPCRCSARSGGGASFVLTLPSGLPAQRGPRARTRSARSTGGRSRASRWPAAGGERGPRAAGRGRRRAACPTGSTVGGQRDDRLRVDLRPRPRGHDGDVRMTDGLCAPRCVGMPSRSRVRRTASLSSCGDTAIDHGRRTHATSQAAVRPSASTTSMTVPRSA
jgi:hypothetical protein